MFLLVSYTLGDYAVSHHLHQGFWAGFAILNTLKRSRYGL